MSSPNITIRTRGGVKKRQKSASQDFGTTQIMGEVKLRKSVDITRRSIDLSNMKTPTFSKDIGIIVAEKVKTLKVEVLPSGKKVFIVLPHDSQATVAHIENNIRLRLEGTFFDIRASSDSNVPGTNSYSTFSLHINGEPLGADEILSEKWDEAKKVTFQPQQQFDAVTPRTRFRKQLSRFRLSSESLPLVPRNNTDLIKQELRLCRRQIKELEEKNQAIKSSLPTETSDIHEIKLIGSGANAVVKSCYVNGWICAMKELALNEDSDLSEVLLLEKLRPHKNLVQYFFHRVKGRTLQIFLKQYSGTLRELIKQSKQQNDPFPPSEIIEILSNIARGLAKLHKKKIIHRDLKSENIFVTQHGGKLVCAIGDFDTAKVISSSSKAKTTIGTCAFIAPEVLASQNSKAYTTKADIFSFGMIIFELLALELPYMEISKSWKISQAILDGVLPKLPELGDEYKPIIDVFMICISPNPRARPTAGSLLATLRKLANPDKLEDTILTE